MQKQSEMSWRFRFVPFQFLGRKGLPFSEDAIRDNVLHELMLEWTCNSPLEREGRDNWMSNTIQID